MFDDENEEPRIDLTSLIDVIFMLVIFFVMTMTFSSKPVLDIVLPESTQAKASEVPEELLVAVKADGSIWADGRPITPKIVVLPPRMSRPDHPGLVGR